jgi:hypothetical protein
MATQTIGAATIADIENALVDQYGRTYLKQLVKTDSSAEWTFRYTSRTSAKCVVNNTAEGVTVTIYIGSHANACVGVYGYWLCFLRARHHNDCVDYFHANCY